ncbi:MAG: hydantoinase/oxoprolinase family protein, partial [Gammaproteobacteria bacterium]|nr:hydantoinase/oxoprolinase family protein [Gammaproteobacteria bacterium]
MTNQNLRYLIGVDIGGTFTDCVVIDSTGKTSLGKVSSTPPNFNEGFIGSMAETASSIGIPLEELNSRADGIYHGCTVGTNALIEDRTARVGLLTTAGHKDSFFIMQGGARLIGLEPRQVAHVAAQSKQDPLVPKQLVEEIDERVAFDGKVVIELNEERCRESIQRLLDAGVEAFAISFMWSIVNPEHERAVARIIREMAPDAFVSVSSDVVSRQGEYQRTVATVINALIGPVTTEYLRKLEDELASLGYKGKLFIMSCTGGLIDSSQARALPLLSIGSGPVAGLIGAGNLAHASGSTGKDKGNGADILTADMGGTTFDVGVIRHGQPVSRF